MVAAANKAETGNKAEVVVAASKVEAATITIIIIEVATVTKVMKSTIIQMDLVTGEIQEDLKTVAAEAIIQEMVTGEIQEDSKTVAAEAAKAVTIIKTITEEVLKNLNDRK